MISISVEIDRSVDVVWGYFTTTSKWRKWWGGELQSVNPGWEEGAKLEWETGGVSTIKSIIPRQKIVISGAFMDTTFTFEPNEGEGTVVTLIESDPKFGTSFNDGGAAEKARLSKALRALKEGIEDETTQKK